MIHGKTKIELYNPNTHIKQIIREENVFQSSVLANYMRSMGNYVNTPYNVENFRKNKLWTNLVGGIFLFKNTIDTSGGVVRYMPAGNQMIANGSYGVSNGTLDTDPTEMGSYNAQESSASESAITQVYDWSTNQGNGQIGCICLTSQVGGYIGYGNASGKKRSAYKAFNDTQYSLVSDYTTGNTHRNFGAVQGNYLYEFSNAVDGVITLIKTNIATTQGSIFGGFQTTKDFDLSEIGNHLGITTHTFHPIADDDGIIWCIPIKTQQITSGATGYIYKLDTATDTLTEVSFINPSTNTIWTCYDTGRRSSVSHGVLGAISTTAGVVMIDLSTGVLFGEFPIISEFGANSIEGTGYDLADGLTLAWDRINASGYNYPNAYVIDHQTKSYRVINGVGFAPYISHNKALDCMFYQQNLYANSVYCCKNPLYLATINNLQTAVTKTAAQTMKVTYTLTEAE